MLKKTIKYVDYNGNEREEDFYFNLSKVELTEMELEQPGGFQAFLKKIIATEDSKNLFKLIKDLVLKSYGVRCPDGSFDKSDELSRKFSHTVAYVTLMMELVSDDTAASAFANGIIPQDLLQQAKEAQK